MLKIFFKIFSVYMNFYFYYIKENATELVGAAPQTPALSRLSREETLEQNITT